jgi:predicted Kef-type K+ transport protein
MLFDPGILVRRPLAVLAVVLLIVFGKSIAARHRDFKRHVECDRFWSAPPAE